MTTDDIILHIFYLVATSLHTYAAGLMKQFELRALQKRSQNYTCLGLFIVKSLPSYRDPPKGYPRFGLCLHLQPLQFFDHPAKS